MRLIIYMIRLPKDFFTNLTPKQYREYLKLLPNLNDEKTQMLTMIGFTLVAMIFFGIFAINPTISTIVELHRQFDDLKFVKQKLEAKTIALSTLQDKYNRMGNDLPFIMNALPQKPEIPEFVAQLNTLLSRTNLKVNALRTFGVELTPDKKLTSKNASSFLFSLEAEGTYEDMLSITRSISRFNRLTVIESVSIIKGTDKDTLILNLRGRQYYK